MAERFFPGKADLDIQCFCDASEYGGVQTCVGFDDCVTVLDKIGRKGGVGDQVASGLVQHYIRKMGAALFDQGVADRKRNQGIFFRYYKNMNQAAGSR